MNLRHAAALALVGWYLMQPPTHRGADGKSVFEDALPLTTWKQIAAYDTAKECQAQIEHMETLPAKMSEVEGAEFMRCIASDDPRLKEK
jgi:hypothetical protein